MTAVFKTDHGKHKSSAIATDCVSKLIDFVWQIYFQRMQSYLKIS